MSALCPLCRKPVAPEAAAPTGGAIAALAFVPRRLAWEDLAVRISTRVRLVYHARCAAMLVVDALCREYDLSAMNFYPAAPPIAEVCAVTHEITRTDGTIKRWTTMEAVRQ